jgi:hypothetical protein
MQVDHSSLVACERCFGGWRVGMRDCIPPLGTCEHTELSVSDEAAVRAFKAGFFHPGARPKQRTETRSPIK